MWCCMGAVGHEGVWSGGVVVLSGVSRERAIWWSRAAPSCRAVGMFREEVWRSRRVACVGLTWRIRLVRLKDSIGVQVDMWG